MHQKQHVIFIRFLNSRGNTFLLHVFTALPQKSAPKGRMGERRITKKAEFYSRLVLNRKTKQFLNPPL